MTVAAAGLAYLYGDLEPPPGFELRLLAETATTVTLGWDPPQGVAGYRFSRQGWVKLDGSQRYSHSWDPLLSQAKFLKGSAWYRVEVLGPVADATYPT